MDAATVIGLVTALVETYADGSSDYEAWRSRRLSVNHYEGRGRQHSPCALSISLAVSGGQIKETYGLAKAAIGPDFATGDACSRSLLWAQLNILSDRVANLHRAAAAASPSALIDLYDLVQICESVRRASIRALADLYRRLVACHPLSRLPKTLRAPRPSLKRQDHHRRPYPETPCESDSRDVFSIAGSSSGEPPSPPPTPKVNDTSSEAENTQSSPQPTNSVFALFCPKAMSLQVDIGKSLPQKGVCPCGYQWRGLGRDQEGMFLKEGFRMTERFLAKSHTRTHSFGCVLCTSTGRSETFREIESLKDHINSYHTKWQLLHDSDCTALSLKQK